MSSFTAFSEDEGDYTSRAVSENDNDEPDVSQGFNTGTSRTAHSFTAQTAFDAYFLHASKASKTSSSVFSQIVEPLTADEYAAAIALTPYPSPVPDFPASLHSLHRRHFARFLLQLEEGFSLAFYGLGSKRNALNAFATQTCRRRGHAIVVNGYQPSFNIKDMISSIEQVPGITSLPLSSHNLESQAHRIRSFFSTSSRPLFLIIHSFDAPAFRTPKARACLSLLLSCPRIRLAVSVDHLNFPLLWSSSEALTRKQSSLQSGGRGHAWLWHDLTTLAPYDTELSFADRTSIRGATSSSMSARLQFAPSGDRGADGAVMTETAAQHILASVTQKAQKLFALIAQHQLEAMDDAGDTVAAHAEELAMAYDRVFNMARDNFVATNDTALRSLLGEFKDHGLVVIAGASTLGSSETLWIPLRKERLSRLLEWLRTH